MNKNWVRGHISQNCSFWVSAGDIVTTFCVDDVQRSCFDENESET